MHVVFRERHGLEETDSPADPGQTPADLAVLSYSDSELASFAAAYEAAEAGGGSSDGGLRDGGARGADAPSDLYGPHPTGGRPEHPGRLPEHPDRLPGASGTKRPPPRHPADESTGDAAHSLDRRGAAPAPSLETQAPANVRASPTLLLANLSLLRHPLSVDHYLDVTLSGAKGILVRLIGGAAYWDYGLTQLSRLARERGIALAVLPADGRADPALDAASTLPAPLLAKLRTLCETGGIAASREALEVMAEAAGLGGFKPPAPALSGEGNQASAREEQNPTDGTAAAEADGAASTPSAATDAMPLSSNIAEHSPGNAALSPATEPASSSTEPLPHEIGERSPGNAAGSPGADPADGRAALMSESITRQLSSVEDGSASPVPPLTPTVTAPMAAQAAPVAAAPATKNAAPTSSQRGAPHPATDSTLSPTPRPTAPAAPKALPLAGAWDQSAGTAACAAAFHLAASRPRAVIVFYRAWAAAGDLAAIEALSGALEAEGFDALGLYVPSLKADEARRYVRRWLAQLAPEIVVSATGFSARGEDGSPLDCGAPVVQIAHATSDRAAWAGAERGLAPADLAMHVVLPEIDGHLFGGVVSFKEQAARLEALQFAPARHTPEPARIGKAASRIAALARLRRTPRAGRRVGIVLSSYPGKPWQLAHAVGLDAMESVRAMIEDLAQAGYDAQSYDPLALEDAWVDWPLEEYRAALARLPGALQEALQAAWGAPEDDPSCQGGGFRFRAMRAGNIIVATQPERGRIEARQDEYHDLSRQPRHAYVAFYLWLQTQADAMIHLGAHGTLEWLPGKAVALSDTCWPEALAGALPVIYPFIANDPGEAAQAKRRICALTLGHMPPPLATARAGAGLGHLEALLDEFATADGLDPRRRDRLAGDIRAEAAALGLENSLGIAPGTSAAEAITRLDSFVCDVKDSRFGDGLHIYGRGECGAAERAGLIAALDARFVAPGPSGSPARGRRDVLPTGRNLYAVDPRAVPTRAAFAQGGRFASELIRRHLQDHGDYPRGLVVDLWGSATMRTAGEEFAMALHLIGARPVWDEGTARVSGVEILPLTELDHPRLDVTLRISGLMRDAFPTLPQLFAQAVRALAARDEAPDWNPYAGREAGARVYGPRPGSYGAGMGDPAADLSPEARQAAGAAWLAASSHAIDLGRDDEGGLRARVAEADAFVHAQDLPESDLLLAADYAAHEAGFAAAQQITGGRAAIWHLDATDPARPRARSLPEETARIVRARAANQAWLGGMMRHGFRGAAEIAATLDHMAAFAHLAGAVSAQSFDVYHDATLGDPAIRDFLAEANPKALAAMEAQFAALRAAGLWVSRRNSIAVEVTA